MGCGFIQVMVIERQELAVVAVFLAGFGEQACVVADAVSAGFEATGDEGDFHAADTLQDS